MQALAAQLLGDATQAHNLIVSNQLVPPYMTLDPSQVYGPVIASGTLTTQLFANARSMTFLSSPQSINTVYFQMSSANGVTGEAVEILSYDGITITFATPTKNTYLTGTQVLLFSSYNAGNTNVLLPGSVLFVPIINTGGSFTLTSQAQITDAFGSDIDMMFSFSNGDLATVSGLSTLIQRITITVQTLVGSLPLHQTFGSRMMYAMGTPGTSIKWSLVISEALLKLPEIADVQNVAVTVNGDQTFISADIYTNTTDTPIMLQNESFTLQTA